MQGAASPLPGSFCNYRKVRTSVEFSGTQTITLPIGKVWAYLLDVNKVAICAPGFQSIEELGEEHWQAIMAIRVGPVKAKFTLDVTRPEKHEPDLMVIKARGKAPGSAIELSGRMNLSTLDTERTRMDWSAHVNVGGAIASVGTRLLNSTVEKLTGQFFECLKGNLEQRESGETPPSP
jgi:carbon monoxide dehydrogenase subunit G